MEELQRKLAATTQSSKSRHRPQPKDDGDTSSLGKGSAGTSREHLKSDIDDIIASECVYCGELMIRSIDKPFIDPGKFEEEKSSWLWMQHSLLSAWKDLTAHNLNVADTAQPIGPTHSLDINVYPIAWWYCHLLKTVSAGVFDRTQPALAVFKAHFARCMRVFKRRQTLWVMTQDWWSQIL